MRPFWWRKLVNTRNVSNGFRQSSHHKLLLETLEERSLLSVSVVSLSNPTSGATTADGQSQVSPVSSVSGNGNLVVYASLADNLVANQTSTASGATQNLFLYDSQSNTTTLITGVDGSSTLTANADSFNAVISGDGSTVAFYSTANNLIAGATIPSGSVELYVYNVAAGTLTLASSAFGSSTTGSNGQNPALAPAPTSQWANMLAYSAGSTAIGEDIAGMGLPSLSSNGQYIAYIDDATNLGADNNGIDPNTKLAETQVFLYDNNPADVAFGKNTLVSHAAGLPTTSATGPGGAFADTVAISGDGTTVAFTDGGTNLVSGQSTNGISDQLYVWSRIDNVAVTHLSAGQTVLASHQAGSPLTGAAIPSNLSSTNGWSADTPPTLSANGNEVAYYYAGDNLVAGQTGTASVLNVFLYDASSNTNTLVSFVAGSPTEAGNNPQNQIDPPGFGPVETSGPQISADGQLHRVREQLRQPDCRHEHNPNGRDNVYLYDAIAGFRTNTARQPCRRLDDDAGRRWRHGAQYQLEWSVRHFHGSRDSRDWQPDRRRGHRKRAPLWPASAGDCPTYRSRRSL